MKLCTFEVKTPLGPVQRLGSVVDGGILDLNAACAWLLEREGEARPQKLADVVLPNNMLEFLQEGATAMCYAKRVLASAPVPFLFEKEAVRLLAPIPNPPSLRDFYAFEDHVKKGFEK